MAHLKKVTDVFNEQDTERRMQQERSHLENLVNKFVSKAMGLIWKYSPDIKTHEHSISYTYSYLDPGTTRIPSTDFEAGNDVIPVYVEATLVADNSQGVHPNSVLVKKIGVVFDRDEQKEAVVIEYDDNRAIIDDALPSQENILTGIRVLDYLEQKHKTLKIPRAPK